jgi:hypothetical protein
MSGVIMQSGRVVYVDVAARAAQLSRDHEFAAARMLLQRHLARSPRNGALWSQVLLCMSLSKEIHCYP